MADNSKPIIYKTPYFAQDMPARQEFTGSPIVSGARYNDLVADYNELYDDLDTLLRMRDLVRGGDGD